VCYGLGGTQPTVTDADLVLGYLDPGYFLGGRMALDVEGARQAIADQVAAPLGLSVEEAAWGIHQSVNESMANAARVHVLERGRDPRGLPVFVFGGAGPVHGFRVARALGAPTLIAPFGAGVMSTVGFLVAPLAFDFVRSGPAPLDTLDWGRAEGLLAEMEHEGVEVLVSSGVAPDEITHTREADMRYAGQGHEIRVPWPSTRDAASVRAAFEAEYERLYGRLGPEGVALETISWRVQSSGPRPTVALAVAGESGPALKGERQAWHPELGGLAPTPVYDRYRLAPGMEIEGPVIVEERESTLVIGPGGRGVVDDRWNLVVTVA
jgi:N-methylhydantoinase A